MGKWENGKMGKWENGKIMLREPQSSRLYQNKRGGCCQMVEVHIFPAPQCQGCRFMEEITASFAKFFRYDSFIKSLTTDSDTRVPTRIYRAAPGVFFNPFSTSIHIILAIVAWLAGFSYALRYSLVPWIPTFAF